MSRKRFKHAVTHRVFKAYYDWFVLNDVTPIHIIVDLELHPDAFLQSIAGNKLDIILNIDPNATRYVRIEHDLLKVGMTFQGNPYEGEIPWPAIRFLYSPMIENMAIGIGDLANIDIQLMGTDLIAVDPTPINDGPIPDNVVPLTSRKEKK